MHPFGGTPICPRCDKVVYAAEQIMGPGRLLYHKPCLACMSCNRRLDSLMLMEHDKEPYCKQCYSRLFGPQDLRQANLPHRSDVPLSSSPIRTTFTLDQPTSPLKVSRERSKSPEKGGAIATLRSQSRQSQRDSSPGKHTDPPDVPSGYAIHDNGTSNPEDVSHAEMRISEDCMKEAKERKIGIPRTVPLSPLYTGRGYNVVTPNSKPPLRFSGSPAVDSHDSAYESHTPSSPIRPSSTGTRYGVALTGNITGSNGPLSPLSPKSTGSSAWRSRAMPGSATPLCARCEKPVYFAEQVKAGGKTFHKPCLRCMECNTALDSTKIAEKDNKVICRRCYSKLYGPQGSGYALLGKAGG